MTSTTTPDLEDREIVPGVAEVYAADYKVGMITWNPKGIISAWYATYANGDETIRCASRDEALELLRLQHAAVQRFARSLRSIRPAPLYGSADQMNHDMGYNTALRDVERLIREVVGDAPDGEGYTAVTSR